MNELAESENDQIWEVNFKNILNASIALKYYDWLCGLFAPYIGERVLEIGSGIGTISKRLIKDAKHLIVSDISEKSLKIVENMISKMKNSSMCEIEYQIFKLGDTPPVSFIRNPFDSIVCINVLEHVEEDLSALINLKPALKLEGRLIIMVPACKKVYGQADLALGHYRRYNLKELNSLLIKAGYVIQQMRYINFIGLIGWWWNSCILKKAVIDVNQFRFFHLLFPLVKFIESRISMPIGVSLIAIATKKHTLS